MPRNVSVLMPSMTIGLASYNEGAGIVATLASLRNGLNALGVASSQILLSDSSDTMATASAARAWADQTGAHLSINHSSVRRSLKEALNVLLAACHSELLLVANADVLVPTASLRALTTHLIHPDGCDVAIGATLPERSSSGPVARAATFQMRAVYRCAQLLPHDAIRAEGAFWGAHRSFYRDFRYTVGAGSLADDVQLVQRLRQGQWRVHNAVDAVVLKIPASTLRDFTLSTRRYYAADPRGHRNILQLRAAAVEASVDPVGFACYTLARVYGATLGRRLDAMSNTEFWEPGLSTKRRGE